MATFQVVVAQEWPELAAGEVLGEPLSAATSVRVDAAGRVFIADPGRHVVDIRDSDGTPVFLLGGPGTGEEEFDSPVDVDPTNGLLIVVADAGNNRLARFRARFTLSETIPLYASDREFIGLSAAALADTDADGTPEPGRPIAVALSGANETFAIDEVNRVVAKWDIGRRLVGLFGGAGDFGQLAHPLALEVVGDRLYVADSERESIVVFDLFGGFVTEIGGGALSGLAGLGSRPGEIWAVHGSLLSVYTADGVLDSRWALPARFGEIVDVALDRQFLYGLTAGALVRWRLDASGRPAGGRD